MSKQVQGLSPQQRLILDHLRHTRGSPIPMERLEIAVYGHVASGGPEGSRNVIKVQMHHLRRFLAQHGVDLLSIGYGRAMQGYMIDPDHLDRLEEIVAAVPQIDIEIARARKSLTVD